MATAKRTKLDTLIDRYYARLAEFGVQFALHEGAVSEAFQTLLADAARSHHWTLIPQLTDKKAGKHIRPDGTLKDIFGLVRGHWEAKDTKDDLTDEVAKKTKKGYPLGNIIFEDTREAILVQNKQQVMRVDLKDRAKIADLFSAFFDYIEPQIESFEKAVTEFKERVPDIAKHLKKYIEEAHRGNGKTGSERVAPIKKFIDAHAAFMEVCRTALNPGISEAAVDDMLVQHLLTERLIREIFDNPEFTRRNVIAAEIEKVIDALTSRSFDRNVFLKSLDRFYVAIENAARTITEWSDKQGFLNNIYERFFQGYNVKLADTMGIVYTPQPIVDFMCASVVEVLEKEFGRSLGDPGVNILDPCTGTGNFIVNLLRRVPKKDLPRVYKEQLFANEIMLLPYYIAALNIEHAYYEQTGEYEPFEGLCFVDTLDLAESHQAEMSFMTAKNSERVERQKRTPITLIVGNPPYNADQESENDNNRNRSYKNVEASVRKTYGKLSTATNKNKLSDPYVQFFRWATDRLEDRDGIVAYVTNNNFVTSKQFDGMRRSFLNDFQYFYHVDLHGDVRKNPKLSGTTHNVFGIQTGVGITIGVRHKERKHRVPSYFRVPETARREIKLEILASAGTIGGIEWNEVTPTKGGDWFKQANADDFDSYISVASQSAKAGAKGAENVIFQSYGPGLQTNRDEWVYSFSREPMLRRMKAMADVYNGEIDRWNRAGNPKDIDGFVVNDERRIKWSSRLKETFRRRLHAKVEDANVREAVYRPFTHKLVLFDKTLTHRPGLTPRYFPLNAPNTAMFLTSHSQIGFSAFISSSIPDVHIGGRPGQCFPFYVYDEDGGNRRENITDWSLGQFRTQYGDASITKWDIFHYVYGLLHHPGYRTKFADNLKRELPRIPFAPDFGAFAAAGAKLAKRHLNYEELEPWTLKWIETPGVPLDYRVEKMKLSKDKTALTVNPSLTLAGIPAEVSEYRLGNRSALEWVIDQYQVSTDKRSGIVSDPNRDDDPEYIVRLVGQVVRVSVETVKIVNALPAEFAPALASV